MRNKIFQNCIILFVGILGLTLFQACKSEKELGNKMVLTRLADADSITNAILENNYHYLSNMQLILVDIDNNEEEVLTSEFASARAAEVSNDGNQIVFSAQKSSDDIWQIWVMDLVTRETRQVTESSTNCTDPAWLPDGKIVFSKQIIEEGIGTYHALCTIGNDGCCEQRVTYHPHDDLHASVMHDGRVLFASRQIYPTVGQIKYMAMRPDGTQSVLFFAPEATTSLGKAFDDFNRNITFVNASVVAQVNFNNPSNSYKTLLSDDSTAVQSYNNMVEGKSAASILNAASGLFEVTYEEAGTDVKKQITGDKVHNIEPSVCQSRPVAKKLPTRVNPAKDIGFMFCLDMNESRYEGVQENAAMVQLIGKRGILTEIPLEEDGSFSLKLKANEAIRFQALDDKKNVISEPSAWVWVRPDEHKGCIGCHEDSDMTPENIVPKAIEKNPFDLKSLMDE